MSQLELTPASRTVPGPAPTGAHSAFSGLEGAFLLPVGDPVPAPASGPRRCRVLSLDGAWQRAVVAAGVPDPGPGRQLDALGWVPVMVPENYGLEASLSAHFGPVYYRRRLGPFVARRATLVFDSVDYLADVWLGDRHLGHHEGYLAPFRFEVTGRLEGLSTLTVRVQDPFEDLEDGGSIFSHRKRVIKGTLKYHDSRPGGLPGAQLTPGWTARLGQSMTTGGIVGSVALVGTGALRLDAVFVTPLDPVTGLVHVAVVVDSALPGAEDALVVLSVDGGERVAVPTSVVPGPGRLDLQCHLPGASLWWPCSHADLGGPSLHRLDVEVVHAGEVSDQRSVRFGLRTARVAGEPKRLVLNGRDVFVQAANYIPRQHFAGVGKDFYLRDMELAARAHLNSLGVHAHVQSPACYEAADEAGLLLFQDFALQWGYDSGSSTNPGFVDEACRQIADMAYTLWNHPSVVYWACHNEPMAMFAPGGEPDPAEDWDNQVLDAALERCLAGVEAPPGQGGRHVHRASGIGDDLHLYDGSLSGGDVYACRQRRSWFVSEYGFWTLGPRCWRWGSLVWPPDEEEMHEWLSRLSFGPQTMCFAGLPGRYPDLASWAQATELYGSFLAKYQTEWVRLHRGDPFFACRWHFFVDWWGWAGGGLLDVDRLPKATYLALSEAARPVLVAASAPHTVFAAGSRVRLEVGALNETRRPLELEVHWSWREAGESVVIGVDEEAGRSYPAIPPTPGAMVALPAPGQSVGTGPVMAEGGWQAELGPESRLELGTLELEAPPRPLASARLELSWRQETETASNWYQVLCSPGEGWFCGPGAWHASPAGLVRLGQDWRGQQA
jgi:beta-mannosidase